MATGAGKTYTACNFIYRLIKYAGAKRVLFLVHHNNLARQTLAEFQKFRTPDEQRLFTELYNVQHLQSNKVDEVSKVAITTIQRLYSMLKGREVDSEIEGQSATTLEALQRQPEPVEYNPAVPIETFDFIPTNECHRSVYGLWRQVLEYFDASIIGSRLRRQSRPWASSLRISSWSTALPKPLPMDIGLSVNPEGMVTDSIYDGPAFKAGISPGMKIVGVNGRLFTPESLGGVISASKIVKSPSKCCSSTMIITAPQTSTTTTETAYPHLVPRRFQARLHRRIGETGGAGEINGRMIFQARACPRPEVGFDFSRAREKCGGGPPRSCFGCSCCFHS